MSFDGWFVSERFLKWLFKFLLKRLCVFVDSLKLVFKFYRFIYDIFKFERSDMDV